MKIIANVITGERQVFVRDNGRRLAATIPATKWKAFKELLPEIPKLYAARRDWENFKATVQVLIDAAPAVHPADASAHVYDPAKLLRDGSPIGDLIKAGAEGDLSVINRLPRVMARETMARAFGSHVIRFTSVTGECLASGVLLLLPDDTYAILTCSHVWPQLVRHQTIQILLATTLGELAFHEEFIQVCVADLLVLDFADPEFMAQAGDDRTPVDAAIITGDFNSLIAKGARAFDLLAARELEPEHERYVVLGYPRVKRGELAAQFLEHSSSATHFHIFERAAGDEVVGDLDGASGGLIIAYRPGIYAPVALMLQQSRSVSEASADFGDRSSIPQSFYAVPLLQIRRMIEKAGQLHLRNRDGRVERRIAATHRSYSACYLLIASKQDGRIVQLRRSVDEESGL